MNPNKKVFITVSAFVTAMVVIACSCGTILPFGPTPTVAPPPNPLPGLDGQWQDPETLFIFTISSSGGSYQVTAVVDSEGASVPVADQSWDGSKLTWSISNVADNYTLTYETVSISGDSLFTNWSANDGSSGTETLLRVTSAVNPGGNGSINASSLTVTSAEAGVVTDGSGVSLTIPAGAVPANDDGSIGSMIFSIAQDTTTVPSLPGGYVSVGPVVNLGPEGFVFEQPVTISIPISAGIDPASVMGASYYDTGQSVWVLVPGSVDATARTIQVSTTHLSIWTAWGLNPQMPVDVNYGSLRIARPAANLDYGGPDATYSSATTSHGICIRSATFDDPVEGAWWVGTDSLQFSVDNYWGSPEPDMRNPYEDYRMPNGSYQLTEIIYQSERNPGDPFYIPHFYTMWRDYGTVIVSGGETVDINFPYEASYGDPEWTIDRPPCWGTVTSSVHTGGAGGVQVTLNWNSNADLDLHVIEPGGEEIYFANHPVASGGDLDRDNQCSDFVLGKPENIFWTTPPNGTYQVNVVYYLDCGGAGPVNFTVRICKNNICQNPISGTANTGGDAVSVTSFSYP